MQKPLLKRYYIKTLKVKEPETAQIIEQVFRDAEAEKASLSENVIENR